MMKKLLLITLPILLIAASAHAKTQYISDDLRVPLRKTACDRCKIIHYGLKAGTVLTVIETNDAGWTHIKTRGGMDGWLPSQYLVNQQIARYRIVDVEKKLATTTADNQALKQQLQELVEASQAFEEQLTTAQFAHNEASSELNDIRKLSSNATSIHRQNQELLTKNSMLQGDLDILSATNTRLRADQSQSWFVYGALAVFMGALLAVLLPRLKRRKKFSEWS